jgi:hypothetical protein
MAFLIGKITEVDLADDEEQPDPSEGKPIRYIIKFREFARVAIDATKLRHDMGGRNPVSYINLIDLGIDADSLDFSGRTEPIAEATPRNIEDQPLTMAQAKKGLALTFGVSPDAVEITIRG